MILGIPCKRDGTPLRPLTFEDECDLINLSNTGDRKARDCVLLANFGLVLTGLARFKHPPDMHDDLLQEGRLGVMRALETMDTSRGIKFSTYSYFWIVQRFQATMTRAAKKVRAKDIIKAEPIDDYDFPDENNNDTEVFEVHDQIKKTIDRYLSKARTSAEKAVVSDRLMSPEPLSIEKLAQKLNLNKYAVKQVEKQVLEDLRDILDHE